MKESLIQVKNLSFSYEDGHQALNHLNLNINKGEKLAIMGANGSGKSTFFLCLNGIHKPQEGQLLFHNSPIDYSRKGLLKLREKIGIVFQDPNHQLFASNVYQEIAFGPLNLGVSATDAKIAVDQIMEELEITPFKDRPTHFLSGGQKKIVSIADVLVMNPDVVIFDEPTAALDPKHVSIVNQLIEQIHQKGITVVISTHDVDYAYEFADRVALFHKGQILSTGTPEKIFSDQQLLKKTNLHMPSVLSFYQTLCEHGILDSDLPLPKTMDDVGEYLKRTP
ncbi:MAG TPA: energy-coupling factor ABC transporter ATP-binding protein [Candidatus Merdenecus merdavium]|nr:energy-coupling factor ABC transporter ATP-binding protein [Candidatus Merdenecus merdavium]